MTEKEKIDGIKEGVAEMQKGVDIYKKTYGNKYKDLVDPLCKLQDELVETVAKIDKNGLTKELRNEAVSQTLAIMLLAEALEKKIQADKVVEN